MQTNYKNKQTADANKLQGLHRKHFKIWARAEDMT